MYPHQRPSIDLHTTALVRIVAGLFALLGLTEGAVLARIPKELHRSIIRILRPAESAARRMIVVLAQAMNVKAAPPRRKPVGIIPAGQGKSRPAFRLFEPGHRFLAQKIKPKAGPRPRPRITFFGDGEYRTISLSREAKAKPPADGKADPAHLALRLEALKAALGDLPRQAQRLARALARRPNIPRLKIRQPLRPGYAPGYRRRRPYLEVDQVLHECDWLARQVQPPNTS